MSLRADLSPFNQGGILVFADSEKNSAIFHSIARIPPIPTPESQFIESDSNGDLAQASVYISPFNLFPRNVSGARKRGDFREISQIFNS